jgi:hypothetical protein
LEAVWSFGVDLTKIPEFHPRVFKVDLLDGKAFREPGVSYQCHLSGGKHTCIEKDIEIIPLQKIVTIFRTNRPFTGSTAVARLPSKCFLAFP